MHLKPSSSSRSILYVQLNLADPVNVLLSSGCKLWNGYSAQLVAIKNIKKTEELKTFIKECVRPSIPISEDSTSFLPCYLQYCS